MGLAALQMDRDRVPNQRAGHAVAAAAPAAELGANDRDDLHARLAQLGVGPGVAVVGEHHAGRQRHQVVAAVPLAGGVAEAGPDPEPEGGRESQVVAEPLLGVGEDAGVEIRLTHRLTSSSPSSAALTCVRDTS
jgi:hypothetical protein